MPAHTEAQRQKMDALEAAIASLEKNIQAREKKWRWREVAAAQALRTGSEARVPEGAALRMDCNAAGELQESSGSESRPAAGLSGKACVIGGSTAKPETPGKGVGIARRAPL